MTPGQDPSRVEAEVAGTLHERIDDRPHADAGHPPDPNADVVRAAPPTRTTWVVAGLVALATLVALALLALALNAAA
jgi:hypothetical protein